MLDHLSELLIPKDFSSISRAVETIALIYHQNVKTFNERNCREMKEKIDELMKTFDKASSSQSNEFSTPQPTQMPPTDSIKQTPLVLHAPPTTPASTTMLQQHQGNAEPRFSLEENERFSLFSFVSVAIRQSRGESAVGEDPARQSLLPSGTRSGAARTRRRRRMETIANIATRSEQRNTCEDLVLFSLLVPIERFLCR